MRIVLDVENTVTKRDGKTLLDPFEETNFLVQVGTKNVDAPEQRNIFTFEHVEYNDRCGDNSRLLQSILDKTTLLIMHNAQHDLMWLWSTGFKYDGEIYEFPLMSSVIILAATLIPLQSCSLLLLPKDSPKAKQTEWIEFETLPSESVEPLPECICEGSGWIDEPFKE